MAERVIQKSLAGRQDILFGHGQVNQTRAGGLYPINKVSMVWACETHAELLTLDTAQFTQATVSYQGAVTHWGWTGSHWYCQETDLTLVGSFEAGFTYTAANQVGCTASDIYSWGGALPKIVPAGSIPQTTGGFGATAWIPKTDSILRSQLYITSSSLGLSMEGTGNSDAITQALITAATTKRPFIFDTKAVLDSPVIITQAMNGLTAFSVGHESGLTWADGLSFTSGPNLGLLMFNPTDRLQNIYIGQITVDGNKANIIANQDNTVHGIVINPSISTHYINVVIDCPTAQNNRGSGILANTGGISIRNPRCLLNSWHGIGVAFTANNYGILNVLDPVCSDNGACGFDASHGRVQVTGVVKTNNNGLCGCKTSVDCESFSAGGIYSRDDANFGFRTTGAAPLLVIDVGFIDVESSVPGWQGVSIATGKSVTVGSIVAKGGGAPLTPQIRLGGATRFDVGSITSLNSNDSGVLFTGFNGAVGGIYTENSVGHGVLVNASSEVAVGGNLTIKDHNRGGTVGDGQYGLYVYQTSRFVVGGITKIYVATASASPSKGALSFSSRTTVNLFSVTGMLATDAFATSGSGASFSILGRSEGVVTEVNEDMVASGDGVTTAFTLTFTTPMTSIGGARFTASVYGTTSDTIQSMFTVYQLGPTLLRIRYASPPPAGTNNLAFSVTAKFNSVRL